MQTLKHVMAELKKCGSEETRKIYARHGIPEEMFGVKVADLKVIAKRIKGNQKLAFELYKTGNYDAMYLAGIVADGSVMTKRELESWAKKSTCSSISNYIVPWLATENKNAKSLALKWIKSKQELIACSGWSTYSGIVTVTEDEELVLDEIREIMGRVENEIATAKNHVRYTMNGFVISVGCYVKPLLKDAKRIAKSLGKVEVDMGETACKVPIASDYISKVEKMGRVGKKRKTIRC